MSRIPSVPPRAAGLLNRIGYRIARRRLGEVPEPFSVTAHHRWLFRVSTLHELALERAVHAMPPELLQLAEYRTAWTVGCSWCIDFGEMLVRLDGLDVERLKDIGEFETSPAYSADEREVIRYADAMTTTPMSVTDEQVAALVERHGHEAVVELTYLIAHENQRARFNHAFGITDQGFGSGDTCRVPWEVSLAETAAGA